MVANSAAGKKKVSITNDEEDVTEYEVVTKSRPAISGKNNKNSTTKLSGKDRHRKGKKKNYNTKQAKTPSKSSSASSVENASSVSSVQTSEHKSPKTIDDENDKSYREAEREKKPKTQPETEEATLNEREKKPKRQPQMEEATLNDREKKPQPQVEEAPRNEREKKAQVEEATRKNVSVSLVKSKPSSKSAPKSKHLTLPNEFSCDETDLSTGPPIREVKQEKPKKSKSQEEAMSKNVSVSLLRAMPSSNRSVSLTVSTPNLVSKSSGGLHEEEYMDAGK